MWLALMKAKQQGGDATDSVTCNFVECGHKSPNPRRFPYLLWTSPIHQHGTVTAGIAVVWVVENPRSETFRAQVISSDHPFHIQPFFFVILVSDTPMTGRRVAPSPWDQTTLP